MPAMASAPLKQYYMPEIAVSGAAKDNKEREEVKLKRFYLLVALVIAACQVTVRAAQVTDLYAAAVPVANQSESERDRVIQEAFAAVLVKVSGKPEVTSSWALQSSIAKAGSYLQSYQYQAVPLWEQEEIGQPLLLVASFQPRIVDQLLREAGEPIWSSSRPEGVFWIAMSDDGKRRIITDRDLELPAYNALNRQSSQRGLPATLPAMDSEDRAVISVTDVWGRFRAPLLRASERYGADFVVAGQLQESAGQWIGNWLLLVGGESQRISTSAPTQGGAVENLISQVSNLLGARLAAVESVGISNSVIVSVSNIGSFSDHVGARGMLERLSVVRGVQVEAVQGRDTLFRVSLIGQSRSLEEALRIGSKLRPDSAPQITQSQEQILFYRWVP